jgi:hypothetical protein
MKSLTIRIKLRLGSWISSLFNIDLLIKRPDEKLVNELRSEFKDLPVFTELEPEDTDKSNPLDTWKENLNILREEVLNSNIRSFLKWTVIKKTMNNGSNADFIIDELRALKKHKEWSFYQKGLQENWIGERNMYPFYPRSSATLIHHGYHLAEFESNTSCKTIEHDCILEFGGGFGSMCRLNFNLGFNGGYIIFDFAHFSLLQRYYLKCANISVVTVDEFLKTKKGVVCISDIEELNAILDAFNEKNSILLIATWSLSEAPISIRDSFLKFCDNVTSFLIAYQDNFENVDNKRYFDLYQKKHVSIQWSSRKIDHLPSDNYLFGKK